MKVVLQRVKQARVEVGSKVVGQIADGLLLLIGVGHGDTTLNADWLVEKIMKLRIFEDEDGKMNKSVADVDGAILAVSQFTLYGDCKKGTRPSFTSAAPPEDAKELYNYMVRKLMDTGHHVETGEFGAYMEVYSINDGPVTLILEA